MAGEEKSRKLDLANTVTVGSALMVLVSVLKGWDWMDDRMDQADARDALMAAKVEGQLQGITYRLETIDQKIAVQLTTDRFIAWRDLLEMSNRDKITVPPFRRD